MIRFLVALAAALLLQIAAPERAAAHPHVYVDGRTELVVDAEGRLTAIRHRWTFDEVYSAFARQGLDANGDGVFSREELQELADVNVRSVAEFGHFTFVFVDGRRIGFGEPGERFLENDASTGQLTLTFVLPLSEALDARARPVLVKVYDPEYFVAFEMAETEPVALAGGAPPACRFELRRAQGLDDDTASRLAVLPPSVRNLPTEFQGITAALANDIGLDCSGATTPILAPMAAEAPQPPPAPGGPGTRELSLLDLSPVITDGPQMQAPRAEPGFFSAFFARVAQMQAELYRLFASSVRAVSSDPFALFGLISLAFLYGVIHAAGPGHGKFVISSYLLATRATLARGIVLSFAAALLQGLVAIGIVGALALVLQATSSTMTRTAGVIEIVSYGLVVLLGVSLVVAKARSFFPARRPAPVGAQVADHVHLLDGSCCAPHGIDARLAARPFDMRALATVAAVGARPCTGALLVLVFALSQGVLWAGLAAVAAMSIGTGVTVAVLAAIAVFAKGLAVRLAARRSDLSLVVGHAIELTGAVLVLLLGAVLLGAALVYGPTGG